MFLSVAAMARDPCIANLLHRSPARCPALTHGSLPIWLVLWVAAAGASLVQLYTAFAYEGPSLVPRIKRELAECLVRDGFKNVAEAVGADHSDLRRGASEGAGMRRSWWRWW